ncbi:hypothetical protein GN244_ATG02293 [Phytophthora infestans]|uniref:Uncharacterized protein n=1 Tax=Phytophthora infestans TaxID=4787 RepID=A0A833WM71_PHYIN|nr:hypothetical protein GN244_ATG02293 [Phytophthora infestans]
MKQRVEVIVPPIYASYERNFTKFHLESIEPSLQFPVEAKIALLSVVKSGATVKVGKKRARMKLPSVSAICKMDQLMRSRMLEFAAPPALR